VITAMRPLHAHTGAEVGTAVVTLRECHSGCDLDGCCYGRAHGPPVGYCHGSSISGRSR
jgi:hypothetical protein